MPLGKHRDSDEYLGRVGGKHDATNPLTTEDINLTLAIGNRKCLI